ncbi:hypothetical protein [Silicimonas sp. MF1-12-2]|uniref:hypothetical protein n=1 Tax=Silicimonas sp. MF1-12-2 TaxID=3384793 RepID=UPI0039B488AE
MNLFALVVFVAMATIQYGAILSDLTRDRLLVLADTARRPFASVAELGIPIGTVRNADAVLARVASSDQAIVAIQVISPEGDVVRSTNMESSAVLSEAILDSIQAAAPGETWNLETSERFLVGANIEGASGSRAGTVLIEYSKEGANLRLKAMEAQLVILAALVLGGTFLVGYGPIRLALAEHLRIFKGLLASFDGFERGFWREEPTVGQSEDDVAGLGIRISEFRDLLDRSEMSYRQKQLPRDREGDEDSL